jgi:hypothetical protein
MGEAAENDIGLFGNGGGLEVFAADVQASVEAGMDLGDVGRAFLAAGDGGDLRAGMIEEDLDDLQGGISRGSQDGDAYFFHLKLPAKTRQNRLLTLILRFDEWRTREGRRGFENTGSEPLVSLRYFGPEVNPDAPSVGDHKKK